MRLTFEKKVLGKRTLTCLPFNRPLSMVSLALFSSPTSIVPDQHLDVPGIFSSPLVCVPNLKMFPGMLWLIVVTRAHHP